MSHRSLAVAVALFVSLPLGRAEAQRETTTPRATERAVSIIPTPSTWLLAADVARANQALRDRRCRREARALRSIATAMRPARRRTMSAIARWNEARDELDHCLAWPDPLAGGVAVVSSEPATARPRVTVSEGTLSGPGTFDAALVQRMIRTRHAAFRACYARELLVAPSLAGTMQLRLTVAPEGTTTAEVVESALGSDELAACVLGIAQRFRFAPGPTGGPVAYDFALTFAPSAE